MACPTSPSSPARTAPVSRRSASAPTTCAARTASLRPGSAIDAGYRLLDTAFNYDNEGAVGRAITRSSVPRESLVYSTKLPGRYHRHDLARWAIEESLFRSGLDRLDLVLIHWPNPRLGLYAEAWRALVEARADGLVSMIGVSNFLPDHLDRIIGETGVTPVLNQILVHPYTPHDELRAANAERGILTEGYSPLGKGTDLVRERDGHPHRRRARGQRRPAAAGLVRRDRRDPAAEVGDRRRGRRRTSTCSTSS